MPRRTEQSASQERVSSDLILAWLRMSGFAFARSPLHGRKGRFSTDIPAFFRG